MRSISLDDDTLVIEMIDLFLEQTPEMLANIESACQDKSWDKMASEIHRFKPNLDYMGMATTKKLIEEIEKDAKNRENLETLKQRFEEVKKKCLHAYKFLDEERSNLK